MPKLYEDDYRNTARDEVTDALIGGPTNWQSSLSQIGKPFTAGAQPNAAMMPAGAVPQIGGAGSSLLPTPPPQQGMMGAMPGMPQMPGLGAAPGVPQMPGMQQMPGLNQRRRMY